MRKFIAILVLTIGSVAAIAGAATPSCGKDCAGACCAKGCACGDCASCCG